MKQPHLVFIFSDQQHWRAAGCRDPFFHTPHFDAFAADAIRFDTVYCTTPLCSPSRATMMTGLMPRTHGVIDNGVPLRRGTIAPMLRQAGYRTAYFGKWHLRAQPVATAGWDEQNGVCDEYVAPNRPLSDSETCASALEFIRRIDPAGPPVALFVSFDQPHGVYCADPNGPYPPGHVPEPVVRDDAPLPASWRQRERDILVDWAAYYSARPNLYRKTLATDEHAWRRYREVYRACVAAYDALLGTVLDALRSRGIYDQAMIVVTADHGDMDAAHRLAFKGPLAYEEVQRVPLAVRMPASMRRGGARVDAESLISLVDLYPTLLECAGIDPAGGEGISLLPVLTGATPRHPRAEAIIEYPEPAVRTIRRGRYKYTEYPGIGAALFDLSADPDELHNVSESRAHAGAVKELSARLC